MRYTKRMGRAVLTKEKQKGWLDVGWVYLIVSDKHCKIGSTGSAVRVRLASYKTQNPVQIKIIELIYVRDRLGVEKYLLDRYFPEDRKTDWVAFARARVKEMQKEMLKIQRKKFDIPDYKNDLTGIMV